MGNISVLHGSTHLRHSSRVLTTHIINLIMDDLHKGLTVPREYDYSSLLDDYVFD